MRKTNFSNGSTVIYGKTVSQNWCIEFVSPFINMPSWQTFTVAEVTFLILGWINPISQREQ